MNIDRIKEELIEDLIFYRGVGYTQEEITERLGVPQSTVSQWLKKIKKLEYEGRMNVSVGVEVE